GRHPAAARHPPAHGRRRARSHADPPAGATRLHGPELWPPHTDLSAGRTRHLRRDPGSLLPAVALAPAVRTITPSRQLFRQNGWRATFARTGVARGLILYI